MSTTNDETSSGSPTHTKTCFGCERVFAVARRRHHCRRCGGVCGSCARNALKKESRTSARDGCWTAHHENSWDNLMRKSAGFEFETEAFVDEGPS